MNEKRYYPKKEKRRFLIPLTLMSISSFFFWNKTEPPLKILVASMPFLIFYIYCISTYTVFYIDEEGLKHKAPFQRMRAIRWEEIQEIKWNDRSCEESNWYCRMKDFPTFIVRVCSEKSYIEIFNYIEDYEELMERFLEECDRRSLGGKVEYKVRAKVWELLDAKREEEEWEDEEMDEEWEEEEDE